ncbi:hypothetical protein NKH18_14820 [Streptomyces sp. M10(2022)]
MVSEDGELVAHVEKLTFRTVDQAQLKAVRRDRSEALFRIDWVPVDQTDGPGTAPARVVTLGSTSGDGLDNLAELNSLDRSVAAGVPARSWSSHRSTPRPG